MSQAAPGWHEPSAGEGPSRRFAVLFGFGLATLLLTWPLAFSPGQAVSVRGDYFVHVWNIWWLRTALFELGVSPFATEMLHAPVGVSLGHHTLSIANALVGSTLSHVLEIDTVLRGLLFFHFWLSAWAFYLFATELTGSRGGAILGGLLFSFNPYHAYYLAQLNVATLEFLPLVAFFMIRTVRRGDRASGLGFAASVMLLAASDFYYLVYGAILCGLLVASRSVWAASISWPLMVRRLAAPVILGSLSVLLVAWPMLSETVAGRTAPDGQLQRVAARSNDLLGFLWMGGPEVNIVAWPTMLGYSTLLICAVGWRGVVRGWVWLVFLGFFLLLSLGPELGIAGESTGLWLPYAMLDELPVLGNLRKPDRFMLMMIFTGAAVVAHAWPFVAARVGVGAFRRRVVLAMTCAVLAFELAPAPIHMFPVEGSEYFARIANDESVDMLVDLPTFGGSEADARSIRDQTRHHKRMPQGYVTSLALDRAHDQLAVEWRRAYRALKRGDASRLLALAVRDGVDVIVLRKWVPVRRAKRYLDGQIVWSPFRLVRSSLVELRQRGPLDEVAVPEEMMTGLLSTLGNQLGPPLHEDDRLAAFRVAGSGK